jgi:hypothetical protein
VPLPPGFDRTALDGAGTNSPYYFGAAVIGRVGCAWIAEWKRADEAGDKAAVQRVVVAMRSSHDWKVLRDMAEEGGWPESVWSVADGISATGLPPCTNVINPAARDAATQATIEAGTPYISRHPDTIAGYFHALELVEPGVVSSVRWRAAPDADGRLPDEIDVFCGVGRKP